MTIEVETLYQYSEKLLYLSIILYAYDSSLPSGLDPARLVFLAKDDQMPKALTWTSSLDIIKNHSEQ